MPLDNKDHDTLVEVVTILKNHVSNFDAHVKVDNDNFKDIGSKIWTHAKFIYIGVGAVGVLQIIGFFHK